VYITGSRVANIDVVVTVVVDVTVRDGAATVVVSPVTPIHEHALE
jgi:hypothetical protein